MRAARTTTVEAPVSTYEGLAAMDAPETPDDRMAPVQPISAASHVKTALIAMVIFTVSLGLLSPLLMTGIARVLFPKQANGSLITQNGQVVGSALIGQNIDPKFQPYYFQNRPSAIANNGTSTPYDASNSGASNYAQTSQKQHDAIATNVAAARASFPNATAIPADLAEASGSGLDPDITPESARLQVASIVANRAQVGQTLTEADVQRLVDQHTDGRTLGILGQPRVNVLALNLALDAQFGKPQPR